MPCSFDYTPSSRLLSAKFPSILEPKCLMAQCLIQHRVSINPDSKRINQGLNQEIDIKWNTGILFFLSMVKDVLEKPFPPQIQQRWVLSAKWISSTFPLWNSPEILKGHHRRKGIKPEVSKKRREKLHRPQFLSIKQLFYPTWKFMYVTLPHITVAQPCSMKTPKVGCHDEERHPDQAKRQVTSSCRLQSPVAPWNVLSLEQPLGPANLVQLPPDRQLSSQCRLTWPHKPQNPQHKETGWEVSMFGLRPSHKNGPRYHLWSDQSPGTRLGVSWVICSCCPWPGLARQHLSQTWHILLHISLAGKYLYPVWGKLVFLSHSLGGHLGSPYFLGWNELFSFSCPKCLRVLSSEWEASETRTTPLSLYSKWRFN